MKNKQKMCNREEDEMGKTRYAQDRRCQGAQPAAFGVL